MTSVLSLSPAQKAARTRALRRSQGLPPLNPTPASDRLAGSSRERQDTRLQPLLGDLEAEQDPIDRERKAWELRGAPGVGRNHHLITSRAMFLWLHAWDNLPDDSLPDAKSPKWLFRKLYSKAVPYPHGVTEE